MQTAKWKRIQNIVLSVDLYYFYAVFGILFHAETKMLPKVGNIEFILKKVEESITFCRKLACWLCPFMTRPIDPWLNLPFQTFSGTFVYQRRRRRILKKFLRLESMFFIRKHCVVELWFTGCKCFLLPSFLLLLIIK